MKSRVRGTVAAISLTAALTACEFNGGDVSIDDRIPDEPQIVEEVPAQVEHLYGTAAFDSIMDANEISRELARQFGVMAEALDVPLTANDMVYLAGKNIGLYEYRDVLVQEAVTNRPSARGN